ncbi:MAG TPA: phospholipase [Solirubrobacteraceae bacterium]|jgi:phospholipase/carboxylesterase|nr:phospholipase [Solirubrobacteraceae bacterium]
MALAFRERQADGDPAGLLVLHHGRGSDELDMFGLGEALDPQRRLHLLAARAPLQLPGQPGWHWYFVPRVGHPDEDTFNASVEQLGALHDEIWERTGIGPERTVLGGFSQGAVMTYALALHPGRPAPAGLLGLSGFIPTVAGWHADLAGRPDLRAFIAHGRADPVISVDFGRTAADTLRAGGIEVDYRESGGGHEIDRATFEAASAWLTGEALSR